MDEIIEVNETSRYALVEAGVTNHMDEHRNLWRCQQLSYNDPEAISVTNV
jgi:hypothetical protein